MKTRLASVVLLVAAAVVAAIGLRRGVETDLFSLVGARDGRLAALAEHAAGTIRVLCADETRAARCRAVFPFDAKPDVTALAAFFRAHGRGLLAPQDRALLEKGELARIRRSVMRRDYAGFGLFAKEDDPCYFLHDYVTSLAALRPKGLSGEQVLLTGRAGPGSDAGLAALVALARADGGIALSGAPFHSLLAAESVRREIGLLGGISLLAVLAIGFWLFRSARFVLPTALALAAGFLVASAAVALLPGRPHALTFLFGTSLVGLGVDYCFHARAKGTADGAFRRSLAQALGTTCLAFAPLLFSGVPILREMSVFTITGLLAVAGTVLAWFARAGAAAADARSASRREGFCLGRGLRIVLFAVAAVGLLRISFTCDPAAFHRPDPLLVAGERAVAAAVGAADARLAVSEGPTLDAALEAEERADLAGISRLLPSARRQRENAALAARMSDSSEARSSSRSFLSYEDLPPSLRVRADAAIVRLTDRVLLLAPCPQEADASVPVLDLRGELASLFAALARETYRLLAVSFLVMALAMLLVFRRRVAAYALPVAGAVLATAGCLGWLGAPVTFFQSLCFFVLTGLGIDYVIFHRAGGADRIVLGSFLTSFVGLGLLAFTSFRVTASMGITLASGLFFAYVLSLPARRADADGPAGARADDWSAQREHGAGRLRLAFMWTFYRLFGKTAAKVLAVPVFACVYPGCGAARRALRAYYAALGIRASHARLFRHLLGFAWTLLDKIDACSLAKDAPRFAVEGDASWMRGGCFLLTTHLGCAEVLPALAAQAKGPVPLVHAFQQMGHDARFTALFTRRLDAARFRLHAVEEIGVETAVEMRESLDRGEIVLMAGDRLAAAATDSPHTGRRAPLRRDFLGRSCVWPKGVFRFVRLLDAPVYALVCVKTGWNDYAVRAERLGEDLLGDYVAFLEREVRRAPGQWYQFHDFFRLNT